jgi:hypothetical protein
MKKAILTAIAVMALSTTAFAGEVNVVVNDNPIDAQGTIVDGRTLVPVRGIFEELGYTVDFDAETKTATLTNGSKTVAMTNNESSFTVNGEEVTPDVPQQIIDGRFMLPLRAVGEAIGAEVNWDGETKTASIKKKKGLTVVETQVLG